MKRDVFLLAKDPDNDCRNIIYHRGGTLKVYVYCLDIEHFEPNPNELQFYTQNHKETLAFETCDYDMEDPGLVIEAIRWYARYIDNPEMEIYAEDPRTAN
ncbi:hypothetical protein GS399_16435 [Pedobacter sp. HMF7647]|uniref:Uncharacterized protein n=1 Tax=Hufsiella arboris TaxID=2695275 RepID=A0A7K1YDA0_9SPHI|nr:hypothetical protein [Hufsiella arboris]MXV52564.1 hypothetical protein [Hufsiella arboris]